MCKYILVSLTLKDVCVCVCVCVCVRACVRACVHVLCACMPTHACIHMKICLSVNVFVYFMYGWVYMYCVCICMYECICVHVRTYVYVYFHSWLRAYLKVCMQCVSCHEVFETGCLVSLFQLTKDCIID